MSKIAAKTAPLNLGPFHNHNKINYFSIIILNNIQKPKANFLFPMVYTLGEELIMPTERQSESARINGAKSHGPTSPEGKEKSSRNSLQHGCTASHTIILACEDPKDFERMVEKYDTMYKPVTLEEQDLVAEMISARWRIRRATGIETNLIDCEMVTEEPKLKLKFAEVDCGMVLASAFRSLADESHSMTLLNRYESRLRRIHKQAHAMLLRLRQERQSEPAPPEPPPAPAPAPDLAPVSDAPEESAPPNPATPPPAVTPDEVIPLTPQPEAGCSPAPILLTPNPEAGCSPPSILSTPKPEARCSHEN